MNPHAEALLGRIQEELKALSARSAEKELALEAIRRQGEERWEAWQAQWLQWRQKVTQQTREVQTAQDRAGQLVEGAEAELGHIEASLRGCLAIGEGQRP
jgi:hypothetical protein